MPCSFHSLTRRCGALLLGIAFALTAGPGHALDLQAQERELQAAVKKVWPAVVMLRWKTPGVASTSGVVFDESGLVLTHGHHGQESHTEVDIVFPDGKVAPGRVETVFNTYVSDWSVISLNGSGPWPAAKLHSGPPPEEGDRCFHIGYGGDLLSRMNSPDAAEWVAIEPTLRIGEVLAIGERGVYADCVTVIGDSGGPLFSLRGEVLGVANQPYYWVVPHKTIKPDLAFGVAQVDRERRDLGFTGRDRRQFDPHRGLNVGAFEQLTGRAEEATVAVIVGDAQVACGLVVRSDGVIVTKRSLILLANGLARGPVFCRLQDGSLLRAEVLGDSYHDDVVLLQVEADNIPAVALGESPLPELGGFVAAIVEAGAAPVPGVVSVTRPYDLPPEPGSLGAFFVSPDEDGVRIEIPEWLASEGERRGEANPLAYYTYGELRPGDVITHINGVRVTTVDDYTEATSYAAFETPVAGDLFELTLKEGEGARTTQFPARPSYGRALESWGPPSYRRTGVTQVFSHDALVPRDRCGGPVVDVHGHVIGVNIARFHKHQTLGISSHRVAEIVKEVLLKREQ